MEEDSHSDEVVVKPAQRTSVKSNDQNNDERDVKAFFDQLSPDCYFGCFKDCVLCRVGQDNFVVDKCLDSAEYGYSPVNQPKSVCPCKRGCNCTRGCPTKPNQENVKPPCQADMAKRQNEYIEKFLEFLKSRGIEIPACDETKEEPKQPRSIRDICQCFPTFGMCEDASKANGSEIPFQNGDQILQQDYSPLSGRNLFLRNEMNKLEKQNALANSFLSAQKTGLAKELSRALPNDNMLRNKMLCIKENEQMETFKTGNFKAESQTGKHVYNINIKLEDPKNKLKEQPSECTKDYQCCKYCQQSTNGNSGQKKNPVDADLRQDKPIECENTPPNVLTYECTPVPNLCNNTHNNEQLLANETITNCYDPLACPTNKSYLHESERLLKDNEQLVRRNELLLQLMRNNEHVARNNENIIKNNEKIIRNTKCHHKKKLVQNNKTLNCPCKPPLTVSKDPLAHECNDPSSHKCDGLAYNPNNVCFKGGKCGPHSCATRLGPMVFGPNACKCEDPPGLHCTGVAQTTGKANEPLKVIVQVKNPPTTTTDTGKQQGVLQCGFPTRQTCDTADERCKCLCQGDVKHHPKPALMPRDYCCLIPKKPIEQEKPQRNCKYLLDQKPRGVITDYLFPPKLCNVPQFACPVELFEQRDDFTWRFTSCPQPCDDIKKVMCEEVPGLERRRLSMCENLDEEQRKQVVKPQEPPPLPPRQDVSKDQNVEVKPSVLKKPGEDVVASEHPAAVVQPVSEKEVKVTETESDFQKAPISNIVKDQVKPKPQSAPPTLAQGSKGKAIPKVKASAKDAASTKGKASAKGKATSPKPAAKGKATSKQDVGKKKK